jgi:trk system potassium uptake protein TrkA
MYDDQVEALEFVISENSKVTGIPLVEMKRKKGLLIAAILRNDKLIIPDGQAQILAGDSVIVVTTELGLRDAEDILAE